ncbi:hypothetical protein PTKIN_Ptkin10aG0087500 [Pterospermum kingtungense]
MIFSFSSVFWRISNTTISRPDPVKKNPLSAESGGLSGKPLFNLSTNNLKEMYVLTRGKIPLIGCGGISRLNLLSA